MEELLSRVHSSDLIPIIAMVLSFLAGMIVWLTLQWRLHRRAELEIALKRDMVERGMSAEEIVRVMRSHLDPDGEEGTRASAQRSSWSA